MTIRQVIHSGPAKANELFAKLAETGDGAVKTRERLFAELKGELELLAGLEERHLFPVLRKHPETKGLAADAVADNKQVRALLSELERMPKGGEEFSSKLAELRKVFQAAAVLIELGCRADPGTRQHRLPKFELGFQRGLQPPQRLIRIADDPAPKVACARERREVQPLGIDDQQTELLWRPRPDQLKQEAA